VQIWYESSLSPSHTKWVGLGLRAPTVKNSLKFAVFRRLFVSHGDSKIDRSEDWRARIHNRFTLAHQIWPLLAKEPLQFYNFVKSRSFCGFSSRVDNVYRPTPMKLIYSRIAKLYLNVCYRYIKHWMFSFHFSFIHI